MDEEKVSARRFELATAPVARTRLDVFRDGIKKFQKKHSEVLGATVYGSMVKGEKAKATSDVDAFLYIDADVITDKNKLQNQRLLENEYRSELLRDLGISEAEAHGLYKDLIPKILSDEVLDKNIEANIEYENALGKMDSEEPTPPTDNFEIAGMFHARVGAGIEKYRKSFLEKLMMLPDRKMAEAIWMGIYAQIETLEAGDKKRKVPATLEEALQTYHPELYKSIIQQKDNQVIEKLKNRIGLIY